MASVGQTLFGNQGWIQGALTNTFNNLQNAYGQGFGWAQGAGTPVSNMAPTGLQQGSQFLYGTPEGYPGVLTNIEDQLRQYGNLGSLVPYFQQSAISGQGQDIINQLQNQGIDVSRLADYANYYMGQGGQTDASRQVYDRAMDIGLGQGAQMGSMGDTGMSLLGGRGQTAYTQNLQDVASQYLANLGQNAGLAGGQNAALNMLSGGGATGGTRTLGNFGSNLLNTGTGLTAAGQAGEQAALRGLQTGGATDLLSQLQKFAGQNVNESVVPTGLTSQAVDAAGAQALKMGEAAYRKALARGGGPGAIVASGQQNQAAAEFENEIMQAQAQAIREAQANTINAKLQQQQLAASYGLNAANQQQQNLATSGNLLIGLENMATGRLGLGTNALTSSEELQNQQLLAALQNLPAYTNTQANAANIYGNLGLGAAGQETSNMALGGNLLNQYNQNRLSGLGLGQTTAGMENQMFVNSGNLSNSLYGTGGQLSNLGLQGLLSGSQIGNQQATNMFGAYNNMANTRLGGANTAAGLYGTNMSGLTNLSGQGMGLAGTALSGQSGLWGGQQSQGMLPGLINAGANMYSVVK